MSVPSQYYDLWHYIRQGPGCSRISETRQNHHSSVSFILFSAFLFLHSYSLLSIHASTVPILRLLEYIRERPCSSQSSKKQDKTIIPVSLSFIYFPTWLLSPLTTPQYRPNIETCYIYKRRAIKFRISKARQNHHPSVSFSLFSAFISLHSRALLLTRVSTVPILRPVWHVEKKMCRTRSSKAEVTHHPLIIFPVHVDTLNLTDTLWGQRRPLYPNDRPPSHQT